MLVREVISLMYVFEVEQNFCRVFLPVSRRQSKVVSRSICQQSQNWRPMATEQRGVLASYIEKCGFCETVLCL